MDKDKIDISTHGIFWCFGPCKSSLCGEKEETEKCRECEVRAWEYEDEVFPKCRC